MSVHSWFPLLMPLPDSSDVASVRIEPHITAEGDGGHQGVACKKTCMYSWQVCPIHGFCAGLSPELHWLHQAVKAFLCLFMEVYRPLFVFLLFFPLSHGRKLRGYLMQGISAALETLPPAWGSSDTQKASLARELLPSRYSGQPPGTWLNFLMEPSLLRSTRRLAKAVITL